MNGPSAAPLDVYALRQTPPARSAWMDAADLGSRIKRGRFLFSRREEIPKYQTALGNHTGGETARPEMNPVARETHKQLGYEPCERGNILFRDRNVDFRVTKQRGLAVLF